MQEDVIPLRVVQEIFQDQCKQLHVANDAYYHAVEWTLGEIAREIDGELCVQAVAVEQLFQNMSWAIEEDDPALLDVMTGQKFEPVDIVRFVEDRQYLGHKRVIRPRVMDELVRLFESEDSDDYLEVVLGGSIGWGKTFFAQNAIAYLLYVLSSYFCPQIEFGLAPGTSIVFIMQSAKLELAKKVVFNQLGGMLKQSQYFSEQFPHEPGIVSELRFPNDILVMPISGADTAALGMNVYGGIIDELNFMARVQESTQSKFTGEGEYDQAEKLYTTALRRMKSRFQFAGRVPGKLFLISSANYPGDFISRKMEEAEAQAGEREKDPAKRATIYVAAMSQWEALEGTGRLSDEKFLVEVGDAARRSRIVESREEAADPAAVIEVPVDYKDDFERDLEGAIRDLAGIPVGGSNSFIKQRDKIEQAALAHEEMFEGMQLFKYSRVDLSVWDGRTQELINEEYLEMLLDLSIPFAAHVDLALTGDSCGIGLGHCSGFRHVGRTMNWDEAQGKYVECEAGLRPSYVIDGALEVIPPRNDEIDINLVGDLLTSVASRLNLSIVTADQFQSASLLQRMRKTRNRFTKRIFAANLSVDATIGPYAECKQAFRDDRFLIPNVDKLKQEFRELQFDPKHMKVDHPPEGSKDVSDGAAGVVHVLQMRNIPRKTTEARVKQQDDGKPRPLPQTDTEEAIRRKTRGRPRRGRPSLY